VGDATSEEDGCEAVEGEMGDSAAGDAEAGTWKAMAAGIAAVTTSRPATRILGIRRVVVRGGWL
jgi:hypothetical protein